LFLKERSIEKERPEREDSVQKIANRLAANIPIILSWRETDR